MSKLPLTVAISDYDHVRDFANGVVTADGIEANFLTLSIEEIFFRFSRYREWDVSEMSMAKYCSLRSQGDDTLSAIPVFPSRMFRHSSIFVLADGPVKKPEDLRGRKVGVPEWAQTAAVYTRGLIVHYWGIPLAEIDWVQAGVADRGRAEKVKLKLPEGVTVTPLPERTLDELLLAGEVAAVMTAHPLPSFESGDPRVVRLFPDYPKVEEAHYRKTGIFPIMHLLAVKNAVLEANPWVATNLLKAFDEAKRRSLARTFEMTASRFPIPWGVDYAERMKAIFGGDYFPYGIDANRVTLAAFLKFAHEQGVCHRLLQPEDLFPETVRSAFKV